MYPSASRNLPAPESEAALKPGRYQTVPYSLVVVVPEPHMDDGFLTSTAEAMASDSFRMPIIKPEVRLVPIR